MDDKKLKNHLLSAGYIDTQEEYDSLYLRSTEDKDRIEQLLKQLPEGMRNCTILFKSCPVGHGWLTATNWQQHECPTCELQETQSKLDKLIDLIQDVTFENGTSEEVCQIMELVSEYGNDAAFIISECECVNPSIYTDEHGINYCKKCKVETSLFKNAPDK